MACHLTSKDYKIKVYLFAQVCQISVSPLCCNAIQIALNNYPQQYFAVILDCIKHEFSLQNVHFYQFMGTMQIV